MIAREKRPKRPYSDKGRRSVVIVTRELLHLKITQCRNCGNLLSSFLLKTSVKLTDSLTNPTCITISRNNFQIRVKFTVFYTVICKLLRHQLFTSFSNLGPTVGWPFNKALPLNVIVKNLP